MQPSTNLSSTMVYSTAGMLLSLALIHSLDTVDIKVNSSFSPETIKYLSEVDDEVIYINKIKSALNILQKNSIIYSFDVETENMSDVTTFLINIPKSRDIQNLVNINMAIADIFDNIPENDRELFTTIQKMI